MTTNKKITPLRFAVFVTLASCLWLITTVLLGIAFGAWLSDMGWTSYDSGFVSVLLWLVFTVGIPVIAVGVYLWAKDMERRGKF